MRFSPENRHFVYRVSFPSFFVLRTSFLTIGTASKIDRESRGGGGVNTSRYIPAAPILRNATGTIWRLAVSGSAMFLCYFDENKYSKEDPFFHIGGILVPEQNIVALENSLAQIQYNFFRTQVLTKETEMHGKEIFHGKGAFKGRSFEDRLKLLRDITTFVVVNKLPVRLVTISVDAP